MIEECGIKVEHLDRGTVKAPVIALPVLQALGRFFISERSRLW